MRAGGQTDRHDKANIRFSQFCECAYQYKEWKNFTQFLLGGVFQQILSTLNMGLNNEH